jgi:hypothetical protein
VPLLSINYCDMNYSLQGQLMPQETLNQQENNGLGDTHVQHTKTLV